MKSSRRFFRAKSLAELLTPTLEPLAAQHGVSQASLLTHWPEIAGEKLAGVCEPARLVWPPRGPKSDPSKPMASATLVLRVAPGFSLDVQHLGPILRERVNSHLGWSCVDKISIRQEPLTRKAPKKQPSLVITPEAREQAKILTKDIENPDLKNALARLGAAVLSQPKP